MALEVSRIFTIRGPRQRSIRGILGLEGESRFLWNFFLAWQTRINSTIKGIDRVIIAKIDIPSSLIAIGN